MRLLELMKITKAKGWRRGFLKDDSAVTAVEFAMVGPLFFTMLFVILETGVMMFTEYVLQTSVQEAARKVRTGQAQELKMTSATFKNEVCELASMVMDCSAKVNVYMRAEPNFTALAASVPSYLSIGPMDDGSPSPASFECGQPAESVALIATYDWDFYVPLFMEFMGNRNGNKTRRLAGFAMFKNESFPTVAGNVCL